MSLPQTTQLQAAQLYAITRNDIINSQLDFATEPKTLRRRKGGFHPPQSDRYVGSEELVELVDPNRLQIR